MNKKIAIISVILIALMISIFVNGVLLTRTNKLLSKVRVLEWERDWLLCYVKEKPDKFGYLEIGIKYYNGEKFYSVENIIGFREFESKNLTLAILWAFEHLAKNGTLDLESETSEWILP